MANIYDDPEIMFHEETELSKDTNTLRAEKDQLVFECIKTRAELDEAKDANRAWAAYCAKLDANLAEAKKEVTRLKEENADDDHWWEGSEEQKRSSEAWDDHLQKLELRESEENS
jgi:hypothetical protein